MEVSSRFLAGSGQSVIDGPHGTSLIDGLYQKFLFFLYFNSKSIKEVPKKLPTVTKISKVQFPTTLFSYKLLFFPLDRRNTKYLLISKIILLFFGFVDQNEIVILAFCETI